MVFTQEKAKKTLNYQETMTEDVENIDSKKETNWRPIYKVMNNIYFKKQKYFRQKN